MENIILSKKQVETLKHFFDMSVQGKDKKDRDILINDLLYGWWARGWKSFLIWTLLWICIAAFPNSQWLIARIRLADLKSTTLATFFNVIKKLGYGDWAYKDNIREERHLAFDNGSKLFVFQVNEEPSDPNFDRIGSYSLTWAFLDEAQEMSNIVRDILFGRLSETSGSFVRKLDQDMLQYKPEQLDTSFDIRIKVVWEAVLDPKDKKIDDSLVKEVVQDGQYTCYITDYYDLHIPYKCKAIRKASSGAKVYASVTFTWNFKGIIFSSCNPWRNFTRIDFWKPYKEWNLPINRKFIRSLVTDNPFVPESYIQNLDNLPENNINKQRLLYGNFDYDDDPWYLFSPQLLDTMFKDKETEWAYYLTVDASWSWDDATTIFLRKGLTVLQVIKITKDMASYADDTKYNLAKSKILELKSLYSIPIENIIVDETWVGYGFVQELGCRGFISNLSPIQPYAKKYLEYLKRNYINLKTQCYFALQKFIIDGKINVICSPEIKAELIEDLMAIKQIKMDMDTKIQLCSKAEMKKELGRSPDLWDWLMMRLFFVIKWYETWDFMEDEMDFEEKIERKKTELDKAVEKIGEPIDNDENDGIEWAF